MYAPRFLFIFLVFISAFSQLSCQQQSVPERLLTSYEPLNEKLANTISADENAISAQEAKSLKDAIFLDAREDAEYSISHIPAALQIGYNQPTYELLNQFSKDRPIVVYCTIGYRSERIAKQLRNKGFSKVYNLYGSIYAWDLAGFPLEDAEGQPTKKVHTYNKKWSAYYPGSAAVY